MAMSLISDLHLKLIWDTLRKSGCISQHRGGVDLCYGLNMKFPRDSSIEGLMPEGSDPSHGLKPLKP